MPKIRYSYINLSDDKMDIVNKANAILEEYEQKGFQLTLRSLYYQFIARDLFPSEWADAKTGSTNNMKSYKRLQAIINDARLGGFVDWNHIVDITRYVRTLSTWDGPADIINSCVRSFRTDKWEDQEYRIIVMIEKDAIAGVIEGVCNELEVPWLSCRGYTSQSEMWGSANRLMRWIDEGKQVVILHLGDHDPSGKNMSEDIEDRLKLFLGRAASEQMIFKRIALNMDQVKQYNPPENPAKTTDSRYAKYAAEFGDSSWELDALSPEVLADLIRQEVLSYRDDYRWKDALDEQEMMRKQLHGCEQNWDKVCKQIEKWSKPKKGKK